MSFQELQREPTAYTIVCTICFCIEYLLEVIQFYLCYKYEKLFPQKNYTFLKLHLCLEAIQNWSFFYEIQFNEYVFTVLIFSNYFIVAYIYSCIDFQFQWMQNCEMLKK